MNREGQSRACGTAPPVARRETAELGEKPGLAAIGAQLSPLDEYPLATPTLPQLNAKGSSTPS
jgi:hypothetical protein